MRRRALLLSAALVAGLPALAAAAPPKASTRTLTYDYTAVSGVGTPLVDTATDLCAPDGSPCWDFTTVKGEKLVRLSAVDATGIPVGLQVYPDGDYSKVRTFCGEGTLKVLPQKATLVSVRVATADVCPGLPTVGTVTAVITN